MKKLVVLLIFLAVISPVFAQNTSGNLPSNVHYFNVSVERVFPSIMGYVVQYRRGVNQISTIGIPNEWFRDAAGRAEMIRLPPGTDWPSMSVFFIDGEFSHVRLYVHRVRTHSTWGNMPQGADVSRHFREPEDFHLEF
jgi:hypothetical protein